MSTCLHSAMASMSTQMASPESSTFCRKCHVYLSVSDADIYKSKFIGSLFKEFTLKGINTNIKTQGTGKSDIEESIFLVVFLSENYVYSTQCLDELVEITDHCERTRQVLVPIFFKVDPSAVRDQRGVVAEAFTKHEQTVKELEIEKVQRWREALTKVASVYGWDSRLWTEKVLIEKIVRDISDKLIYASSSCNNSIEFVGMGSHIIELEKILCLKSNAVQMVGIWGMGGIGKTTIAKVVFDRLSMQFEVHCFLENVKQTFTEHGAAALQQKILLQKRSLNTGIFNSVIKRRLCHKKVLLVLDDVDDWKQLEALAREPSWFGPGSRIIITSRDKHLLAAHGVKDIYEVKHLKIDQGLQLFSQHAFKQNNPEIEFLEVSQRLVSNANCHPLALKVLGSFLRNSSMLEWQTVQDKLAMIPDLRIQDVLKVSFDGLEDTQREVFLDIACFFNGENKEVVRNTLECCGFFPDISFAVLKDKALITIEDDMAVRMHDLLQEVGHDIVRQESKDLGKRSRLWNHEEIHEVLSKNMGSKTVESISLDMIKAKEMHIESNAFTKMHNLRLLNFYVSGYVTNWEDKLHLHNGLVSLPNRLRYLQWHRFPMKSLPPGFCAENIVELVLTGSSVQQLWTGVQNLVNLKTIKLSGCQYLTTIPDLSTAKNIETIDLKGCGGLIELPSCIEYFGKLNYLNLTDCSNLRILPDRINSRFLQEFHLGGCSNVNRCPEVFGNLDLLDLSQTAITELPQSVAQLTALGLVDLSGCYNITKFPEISADTKNLYLDENAIEAVPSSIQFFTGLRSLKIINNKKLVSLPSSIWKLKSLKILDLSGCSKFEHLPEIMEPMEVLTDLYLKRTAIKELPSTIEHLKSLSSLMLDNCRLLLSLPSSIHKLSKLCLIHLNYCKRLGSLPEFPESLKVLVANQCESLENLSARSKCNLDSLHFVNCSKLDDKTDAQLVYQHTATKICRVGGEARILYRGSEIPEWFHVKSKGSSVTTQLPWNLHQLKGVVVCVVFTIEEPLTTRSLKFISPSDYWIRCKCYVTEADDTCKHGDVKDIIWDRRWFDVDIHLVKSDHVLMWSNPFIRSMQGSSVVEEDWFNKYSGKEACFEFYFEGYSELLTQCKCIVNKCGVLLLYDDEDEAVPMPHKNFASNEVYEQQPKKKLKFSDFIV